MKPMKPPKEMVTFRLPLEIVKALRAVKEHQGIAINKQVEFAYREWLERNGLTLQGAKRPPAKRRGAKAT